MSDLSIEERIAILETLNQQTDKEIKELFDLLRKHMEKEEQDRDEVKQAIRDSKQDIADIKVVIGKQKSFLGGVVFTVTSVWTAIIAGLNWMKT